MFDLRRLRLTGVCIMSLAGFAALTGCEEQGPFERSGERADEAMEDAGEEIEKAGEEIQEKADG